MIYKIAQMTREDIPLAVEIWYSQFLTYSGNDFPDFFPGGKETIVSFLIEQIEKENALTAKQGNQIVGFIAWVYISFHDEETAFCPTVGHAAWEEGEEAIYYSLYVAAAKKWVSNHKFNHLWMTFYNDIDLKNILYDLGFGSYVVDACHQVTHKPVSSGGLYKITRAIDSDADSLTKLANEARQYYWESPIFLKSAKYLRDDIVQIIKKEHVFVAWDNENLVGMMDLSVDQGYHYERLTIPDSARIEHMGAYIKPEYRGKGIGSRLLEEIFNDCYEIGKPFVHVSFESANAFANRFWPKYFKPIIRSVRRSVNKDGSSLPLAK